MPNQAPERETRPATTVVLWLAIAVVLSFSLFWATRSAVHSWDSIAYTARSYDDPLLSEKFLSTARFHPHHLLYVPLAQLFVEAAGTPRPFPFGPLLLLSCLAGAACVGLGGWIAWRVAGTREAALATAAFLTLANTTWLYATTVEVMMPALCLLLLGAALLTARSSWAVLLAGLAVGAAVLLHQIVVLYAIVFTLVLARRGVRRALLFAVAWGLPVVAIYLWVALRFGGADSLADAIAWTLSAAPRSQSASSGLVASVYQAVRTAAEGVISLVPITRLRAGYGADPVHLTGAAAVGLIGVFAILGWSRALRTAPPDSSSPARIASGGLLWGSLLAAVFIGWFQARTIDYWVYVVAGLGIWAFGRLRFVPRVPVLLWLGVLGLANLYFRVLPMRDAANAPYSAIQEFADTFLRRGDVFWMSPADTSLEHALVVLPFLYGVETEVAGTTETPSAAASPRGGRTAGVYATAAARSVVPLPASREWTWAEASAIGKTKVYRLLSAPPPTPRPPH